MKIKARILSLLIVASLMTGMLPVTVFAEGTDTGKAIQLGTDGISGYSDNEKYSYIYYGIWNESPVRWRVLDDQTNTGETGMFLLSDGLFDSGGLSGSGDWGGVLFEDDGSNEWQGSDAQSWCKDFFIKQLSSIEQNAVLGTYKNDAAYESRTSTCTFAASDEILYGDKVFFLSAEEIENENYGFTDLSSREAQGGDLGFYFLRSPDARNNSLVGMITSTNGGMNTGTVEFDWNARPAFNLDTAKILFVSAAVNGKTAGTSGTLSNVVDYTGSDWKLTLSDDKRNEFSASTQSSTSIVTGYSSWSIDIDYSGAQTGTDNEYVSALLCDSNDNVLYYGNIAKNSASGTATLNIPSGLEAGKYTLKVFSEQCNGNYKTDYASAFQNIDLTVILPPETKPNASFEATSDNGGILSNVDISMKYSVDNGNIWNAITGTTMEITGVTEANDVKVYKSGNGTTTSDSDVQTIDVTQADQPTGLDKTDCTTSAQNNGQITGVNDTMEYKLSMDSGWTGIYGTAVTGLKNGTYYVRVKATGTVLASAAETVVIGEHICVGQGNWLYGPDSHWKLCTCGAIVEEAAHSGGTATCTAAANCEVCGQPYGQKDPDNHTGTEAWITTDTAHTKVWSCCQAVIEGPVDHTWENGICAVCGYNCVHTGGTATCSQLAQCELCGSLYGDYDPDNHKALEIWTQENGKHYHVCEYGCGTHLEEADCFGGTATCTAPAVCEVCGQSYGEKNMTNHTGEILWTRTDTTHSSAYSCCGTAVVGEEPHTWENGKCTKCGYECQHTGSTATCIEKAICEICKEEYGQISASSHTNLVKKEAKPATHLAEGNIEYYYCDGCKKYFTDEGGTQETTLEKTILPKLAEHTADGTGWHTDPDSHWHICACGEKLDQGTHIFNWVTDQEASETKAGLKHEECTVCGYKKEGVEIPATGTTDDPSVSGQPAETPSASEEEKTDNTTTPDSSQIKDTATSDNSQINNAAVSDKAQTNNPAVPETGDNSQVVLWGSLILAAGVLLSVIVINDRKKKSRR